MFAHHLSILVCPTCEGELTSEYVCSEVDTRIRQGMLRCDRCARSYPIRGGVPRFVDSEGELASFGYQWNQFCKTQLDGYSGTRISETRFFAETKWPRRMAGELLLEVGSGAGRFTEIAAKTEATVVSLDYSAAVDANYANNGHNPNVLVVQASLYEMPFRKASFDRLFCFGVLQHTPDVKRSFMTLPQYLKPGGHLAIDVYRKGTSLAHSVYDFIQLKNWVRPVTKQLPPATLFRGIQAYVSLMWPLARLIGKIPRWGVRMNTLLLIADNAANAGLSDENRKQWAILDTLDWLSPKYDSPQTIATVTQWFQEAQLGQTEIHPGYNGIEGRAVRAFADERPSTVEQL